MQRTRPCITKLEGESTSADFTAAVISELFNYSGGIFVYVQIGLGQFIIRYIKIKLE